MPIFKLLQALPQSAPGNTEYHYGHRCEVRNDGVYIDLRDDATIANFIAGRRITKHSESPSPAKVEVDINKPLTATEVMEQDTKARRGRPSKDGGNGLVEALGE